jgi:hypothetical protein
MTVLAEIAFSARIDIGEVATPTAGNQNFLAGLIGMINHQHPLATLTRNGGTHEPGPAGPEDDGIISLGLRHLCHGAGDNCFWQRSQWDAS